VRKNTGRFGHLVDLDWIKIMSHHETWISLKSPWKTSPVSNIEILITVIYFRINVNKWPFGTCSLDLYFLYQLRLVSNRPIKKQFRDVL